MSPRPDTATLPALQVGTLAGLSPLGAWQIALAHDRPHHLLIWITRGQGRALLGGTRRGFGTHNALFIPAGDLMALEIGRQGAGLVLTMPSDTGLALPAQPRQLRIRNLGPQTEIAVLLDQLTREQSEARPRFHDAMAALAELVAIWLRRQLGDPDNADPEPAGASRLSRAYCARVAAEYRRGDRVADHAAALGVSTGHLTRTVQGQTGRGAAGLLAERRAHAARTLLASTDAPVANIARHLGFNDAAGFARFIRRQAGAPPSALRSP